MMKKILYTTVIFFFCFTFTNIKIDAQDDFGSQIISTEKVYLGNGIYKETIIVKTKESTNRSNSNVGGYKTIKYKSGNNVNWSLTVHGTFSYNGSSSTCLSASSSVENFNSSEWTITKHYASRNGASATAYVTAQQRFLGLVIKTINDDVTLSCSKTGDLF